MTERGSGRFDAFDGLRAIAVLLVYANHVKADVFPGGWLGVDLFFVLSGYLITSLLLGEREKTGSIQLRAFYVRRFLRLMPALTVTVLVTAIVTRFVDIGRAVDSVAALLYLMDIYAPVTQELGGLVGHTWSLAVEEQFYLVWPLVLVFGLMRRWRFPRLLVAAAVVCVAAGLVVAAAVGTFYAYRSPFPHVPELLAGVGLAFAVRRNAPWLRTLRRPWVAPTVLACLVAGSLVVGQTDWWLFAGGLVAVALALAAMVGSLVVEPTSHAARALSSRPLVWLGQRSYGFYLWHFPVVVVLEKYMDSGWVLALVALPLSLFITVASWRLVEQPFLRMKERFERPGSVMPTVAPSVAVRGQANVSP